MPVEESGNMILLCAAIAKMEGNADFSARWWPQLTRWESYLEKFGKDPENQLCTDDFMGHLAHNANLSIKAILAIAAYGELCRMRGDDARAGKFQKLARRVRAQLDGRRRRRRSLPHRLRQAEYLEPEIQPGLGQAAGPQGLSRGSCGKEVAYYKKMIQRYGVPLDSRTRLTKTDWCLWSATLADNRADFEAIVSPIDDYLNQTTARLPFVDSYVTDNPKSDGMGARPVIGGVFIKMLEDPKTWKKWSSRDRPKSAIGPPHPFRRASPKSCRPLDISRLPGATRSRNQMKIGPDRASTTVTGSKALAASAREARPERSSARPGTRRTSGSGARSRYPRTRTPPGFSSSPITTRTSRSTSNGVLAARKSGFRHDLRVGRIPARRRWHCSNPGQKSCWPFTATKLQEGRGSTLAWWMSTKRHP